VRTAFQLSGGPIAALDTGRVVGPTVLMLPGYPGSKEDFLPLLRPLADAGYRAVAIDQRGQYESDWAAEPAGYTIEALGAEVCELAAKLSSTGSTLHLLGHSFGGLVARAAVLLNPALFGSLSLMGSGSSALAGDRRTLLDLGEKVLAEEGMAGLWAQLAARAQADPSLPKSAPDLQAFLEARFMANDPVGLQVMGQALRTVEDATAELAAAGVPILVVHGESEDAWPPPLQAEMAKRLGAVLSVINAAAHSPAVENPAETVTALLDFWRSVPGQR
jgi:pimeloyl-ACP methyl ester carboxylesterase